MYLCTITFIFIFIKNSLCYTTQIRGTRKINYFIIHDDATQRLVMNNMTSDILDVISYITTWEKFFGDMAFFSGNTH